MLNEYGISRRGNIFFKFSLQVSAAAKVSGGDHIMFEGPFFKLKLHNRNARAMIM